LPGSGATYGRGPAGEAIATGDSVYKDASDNNKIKKADNNLSAAASAGVGVAAHAAAVGQDINYFTGGQVSFGAILLVGEFYFVGPTAGQIIPSTDLATGMYPSRLFQAITTSIAQMDVVASGVARG
jgi:hypothetical protein